MSLQTRRKRGDLIQFYKVHFHLEWKNKVIKTIHGEEKRPVTSYLK